MNYVKPIYAGVIATAAMTAVLALVPLTGLQQVNLASLFGSNAIGWMILGWIVHFIIGIAYAFIYKMFINEYLPIESNIARGMVFGIILFVFSTMAVLTINLLGFVSWNMKESMSLAAFGYILAFIVYGAVVGGMLKRHSIVSLPT